MASTLPVRCAELWILLGNPALPDGYLPARCCSSCHEDEDYGYPLADPDLPDGRHAEICCSMLTYLHDHPLPEARP